MQILRYGTVLDAVVDETASNCTEIPYEDFAGGLIFIPNGTSINSLKFDVAPEPGGTYERLYNSSNAEVAITAAADRSYPLPDELFGAGAFKIITNSITAETVKVSLKG